MEIQSWEHLLVTLTLCLPRFATAMAITPLLSSQILPGMVRRCVLFSWIIILVPMVAPTIPPESFDAFTLAGLILKEVFIGALIGFTVSITIWGVQAAGFFIDNQRGAAMASSLDPLVGEQTSPLGILFVQFLVVYVYSSGAFLLFLQGIYQSYRVWPITGFLPVLPENFPTFFLEQLDWLMKLAVVLAGPIILIMFLAEMGLALISRFAPQLQVFFLAMPVKSGIAMFLLIFYITLLLGYVKGDVANVTSAVDLLQEVLN